MVMNLGHMSGIFRATEFQAVLRNVSEKCRSLLLILRKFEREASYIAYVSYGSANNLLKTYRHHANNNILASE